MFPGPIVSSAPLYARRYWLLFAASCLSACMRVGPDFHPQHESWTEHWSSASTEQVTRQATQPDVRQWWQIFADHNLESLIAQADVSNGDVKIAGLRVLEARAQLGIAIAGRYPQVQQANVDVLYSVRKRSDGFNPRSGGFWQYGAGFSVGWELDFWGRFSRAIESAQGAARRSLKLANTIYREGYSDFQRVLDAQRTLFAQQDAYIVNRGNAVGSLIALYKALGGGWYSEQPLVDPATRQQMQQRTDWGDLLNESDVPSAAASSPGGSSP